MSFKDSKFSIQTKRDRYKYLSGQYETQSNNQVSNPYILKYSSAFILKNTQFLTQLQNYLTIKIPYKQTKIQDFYQNIDISSFCRLIVQNIYLLQISYMFQIKLYISKQLYIQKSKSSPNSHNINIFQLYCFQNQINEQIIGMASKKIALNKKFYKIFEHQQNKCMDFFFILQRLVAFVQIYFQCLKKSQKPTTMVNSPQNLQIQTNRKFLIEFLKLYRKIVFPQKKRFQDHKPLLKILQQTKLFRAHGMLVKITNCTLFYSIKNSQSQKRQQIQQFVHTLKTFFQQDKQQILQHQKQIQKYIDYVFTYLCRNNFIQIGKSLKTNINQQEELAFDAFSIFQKEQDPLTKIQMIIATLTIPQKKYLSICPQLLQTILQNSSFENCTQEKQFQITKNLQVEISYVFVKNQIKVRCITQIDISIQNLDYQNYLMSIFNQTVQSSIFIDTVDKFRKSASKRKQKVIVFRLSAKLNNNQQPLTKIFQFIDISILAAKVFMAELSKKSFIKLDDNYKRIRLCEMFKHYQNLLRNVMKKFYSQMEAGKQ